MESKLIGCILMVIGTWLITDGIYSWTLYLNAPSYEGSKKQTFWRDHWVRMIRILNGLTIIILGYLLI